MARAKHQSLRFSRFESKRLIIALLLSLCVHVGVWQGYELGKKYGWWERLHRLHWREAQKTRPLFTMKKVEPEMETPRVYVDVSQADVEATKKAIYYSDKNSRAANPDADKDLNQPKITGDQKDVPKTEDVAKPSKLQSNPTPPTPPENPSKPKPPRTSDQNLGDEKLAKTEPTNQPMEQVVEKPERPRTLAAARAQQQHIVGHKMQQDGGVQRTRLVSSLDAKATAFGQYDGAIFAAIQQYWQDELDRNQFAQDRAGRVTIRFTLHYDGTVDHVEIVENDVGILLGTFCQESIDQTAPYGKWPSDMLHEIGSTVRPVTITFIYY
jgi:outer membrane biosynthesis protein TonB